MDRHRGAGPNEYFLVIDMPVFRRRYPPELLRPGALHTARIAQGLRRRLGRRNVLGLAFYPWHDQSTLWWFEQGMLTLLAATGWPTVWVTDARYAFDDDRLTELKGAVSIVRQSGDDPDWHPPGGNFDTVIALFPNDRATRAAATLGATLVTFAIKNLHEDEPVLVETPPPGTPLWHAFAGSTNFMNAAYDRLLDGVPRAGLLGKTAPAWRLMGAPFPTNRYYFPLRPTTPKCDALIFGSKSRDYDTVLAALARTGAGRIAALVDTGHVDEIEATIRRYGLAADVHAEVAHTRLLELIERTRIVLNPIMPPAESHYSMSVPLAMGRPIVATDLPSTRPFAGPGVRLANMGDVDAWAAAIGRFGAETADALPHRGALTQGLERHDLDRFFASALLATLGGNRPSPPG
ncbi:hypothetical protein L6Q96_19960 [Candidatus Binatia bacterium]|nr:hypothetical protein [Candidatus Binatia bacterium]